MNRLVAVGLVAGFVGGGCGGEAARVQAFSGVSEGQPSGSAAIGRAGMVAAFDMEPAEDGTLPDHSGRRIDGMVANPSPVAGRFGAALDFSDVGRRAQLPASDAFDLDGPLTIAVWVRVDQLDRHQHIVACDDKWALWVTPDNRYRLGDTRGGGWSTVPGTVRPGEWTSLVAVLRGTRGDPLTPESVTLFVDGEAAEAERHLRTDEARETATWNPGVLHPTDACYVGFESHQGEPRHQRMPFFGAVDELLIFERAWSETEARAFAGR